MLNSMRDNNGSTFSLYKLKTSMCFSPRHTIFTDKPRHTWLFISPITGNHRQIKISGVYDLESEQLNFSSADSVCSQYQLPTELRVAPHPTLWPGVCVEHRCRTVLHMLHTAYPVVLSRLLGEDTVITCSHSAARFRGRFRISRYLPTTFFFKTDRIDG